MAALRDGGRWIVLPVDTLYHPGAFKCACVLVLQPLTHSLTALTFRRCICTLKTDTLPLFYFLIVTLLFFFPPRADRSVFVSDCTDGIRRHEPAATRCLSCFVFFDTCN